MSITVVLVVLAVCGVIAAVIGSAKNLNPASSFLLGAVLGVIGIVIVAVLPRGVPEAPAGMRAVKCKRCNAVQNVPVGGSSFECWQCKHTGSVAVGGSEDAREWLDRVKKKP